MDPKEYAARLQRMQDEIETAKAREQISNGYNKAMETSPMVDTTERLYAEFKAAKKPKAKKRSETVAPPAVAKAVPASGGPSRMAEASRLEDMAIHYTEKYGADTAQKIMSPPAAVPPVKPVVTAPAAQPRTSDRPPDEALMAIERMSPEEAMAEWSQIASSTGVTGKKSPRDAVILEALRKKKSLYDDSKVKQAPATPYVPSFLGGKK